MKKKLTIEEAKQMIGTEFTYVFEDGDTIQAYIKKFDPEIGLTAITLETETRNGWKPFPNDLGLEKDGTFCVISHNFKEHLLSEALEDLYEIKCTNMHDSRKSLSFSGANVSCNF